MPSAFVAFQELLEAEAGLTMNQPRHLAVRQAIEKSVYGMTVEGAELGLWEFGDDLAGQAAIAHYRSAYAPAYNDRYNDVLPPQFYAAHERERRVQLAEARQQRQLAAQAQAQAATGGYPSMETARSVPHTQAVPPAVRTAAAVNTSPEHRPQQQSVQAETTDRPQTATAPQQRQTAQTNRALSDALSALTSIDDDTEGRVEITKELAQSLHAVSEGRAGLEKVEFPEEQIEQAAAENTAEQQEQLAAAPSREGRDVSPP